MKKMLALVVGSLIVASSAHAAVGKQDDSKCKDIVNQIKTMQKAQTQTEEAPQKKDDKKPGTAVDAA